MPQSYGYWDDPSQNRRLENQQENLAGQQTSQASVPTGSSPAQQSQHNTEYSQQPGMPQDFQQQRQRQQHQQYQQVPAATYEPAPQPAQVAYVPVQQPVQKKSRGWIVALVLIVCLFAFMALCVKSCSDVLASGGVSSYDGGPSENSIAVIDIDGTIQYDGSACSPEGLKSLLDRASDNSNIKGVVLRVNSGGGTSTAGEEMADYVREFDKPIVVSSASINASAAYEISSQANYIYVAKSTEIGSIGTVMELTDISGLFDMLGVDVEIIKSADSKDSTYGYRELTDEEREYYQHMVDQINDMFIENVAQGRSMDVEAVRALATGLVYTGVDAVENGLADEVGTLEDAVAKTAELAGIADYNTFDLSLTNYDISSLYYLLGGQNQQRQQQLQTPLF